MIFISPNGEYPPFQFKNKKNWRRTMELITLIIRSIAFNFEYFAPAFDDYHEENHIQSASAVLMVDIGPAGDDTDEQNKLLEEAFQTFVDTQVDKIKMCHVFQNAQIGHRTEFDKENLRDNLRVTIGKCGDICSYEFGDGYEMGYAIDDITADEIRNGTEENILKAAHSHG